MLYFNSFIQIKPNFKIYYLLIKLWIIELYNKNDEIENIQNNHEIL